MEQYNYVLLGYIAVVIKFVDVMKKHSLELVVLFCLFSICLDVFALMEITPTLQQLISRSTAILRVRVNSIQSEGDHCYTSKRVSYEFLQQIAGRFTKGTDLIQNEIVYNSEEDCPSKIYLQYPMLQGLKTGDEVILLLQQNESPQVIGSYPVDKISEILSLWKIRQ